MSMESEVKLTLKLLILGLFIGQGLGFKGAYLDPGPTRVGVGSPTRVQSVPCAASVGRYKCARESMMNTVEKSLDFLSLNFGGGFKKGKLKLPLPIYTTYGESLPTNLVLHGPFDEVWPCTFKKGDNRIHGLEKWMDYYKIKPYNVVLLTYLSGADFRFVIFSQYAVEMNYLSVVSGSGSKNSAYEVDKLACKYKFNGFCNFVGKYNLLVEPAHLVEESFP
ncbi:hypothetical protein ACET3Z_016897 [Daucus carota]